MCDAGHPKPVLCDNLKGSGEEGWGRGSSGWRGHMYTCAKFILMYGKNHCNVVIIFQLK